MAHDASLIANTLIKIGVEKNKPLTPMQIIKLVYICHGFMLGLYHRPLINQEIKAWKYGPYVEELYESMKKYGSLHVTKEINKRWFFASKNKLDEYEQDLIEQVFSKYSDLSGIALSTLTHREGTPWDKVWNRMSKKKEETIPNDMIEDYYSSLTATLNK